jgi:hypothetical protein
MPMATDTEKNSIATKYGADTQFFSLHSADPGSTGANELTGGSPSYARKASGWSAPNAGVITGTATFDVPPGATVAWVGVWSAATGGNFLDKAQVSSQSFSSQGQYQVNASATAN